MLPTHAPPTLTSDGGVSAPGAQNSMKAGVAGKGARVVDTDNVPRPQFSSRSEETFNTLSLGDQLVPSALSNVSIVDGGNASPAFMRVTMNQVPANKDIYNRCKIPLSVVLQPLNDAPGCNVGWTEFPTGAPVRCTGCKGYINASVKWRDGGREWICNLCGLPNVVNREYYAMLDHSGRRVDASTRPELSLGSYEFTAPESYANSAASYPSVLFLIDVSHQAVSSGFSDAVIQSVRQCISDMQYLKTRVGIAMYDRHVYFFDVRGEAPKLLVMSNFEEPFNVMSSSVVMTLETNRDKLNAVLDLIPKVRPNPLCSSAAMGAAVKSSGEALAAAGGGRLIVFAFSPCSAGPGTVKRVDDPRSAGTERDKNNLLKATDMFYNSLSDSFVKGMVSVDFMIATTGAFMDASCLAPLSSRTGGLCRVFNQFNLATQHYTLFIAIHRLVCRPVGLCGVMRMRASVGISVKSYLGSCARMHETDVDLAVLDPDKSMVAELTIDGKLTDGASAVFQCALMYTRSDGVRALRIHTVSLPTTPKLPEVFRYIDGDALAVVLAKRTVAHIKEHGFETSNSMIRSTLVDILACYRKDCAINPAHGQLILPDAIKALACQSVCFLKSPGLRPNSGISTDYRVSLLDRFLSASIRETLIMMYPRLFPVHTLADDDGVARPSDGSVSMPPSVKTMQESLRTEGAFLLDGGDTLFLWLGDQLPGQFVQDLFGVQSKFEVPDASEVEFGDISPLASKLSLIVGQLRRDRNGHPPIKIVQQKAPTESLFLSRLLEDKLDNCPSYMDYLCSIHTAVLAKV